MNDLQRKGVTYGAVQVWADGACTGNHTKNKDDCKAGFGVWFNYNHSWNARGPLTGAPPTNQNAEIEAAIQAIKICSRRGLTEIEIRTDSKFVIEGVTTWIKEWKKNGWKNSQRQEVVNKKKFQELDQVMTSSGMKISWVHVPGHRDEEGNIEADELAQEGARLYRRDKY